jgi:putative salt-induced outer membrane protein YdiY
MRWFGAMQVLTAGGLGLLVCEWPAGGAAAQETAPAPGAVAAPWTPPEPSDAEFDWVQLKSGEWLKGELENLRDRKISFDSDELDDLELDFADVTRFHLPRPHSYRVESGEIYRGSAEMRDGRVRVRTDAGIEEFGREDLVSIVRGVGRERDRWSTKVSLGVALRRGNTDQTDLTGLVKIRREDALTRLSFDYNGVISSVSSEQTANSHRVYTDLDVFLTGRLFVTAPLFEFYRDRFQNIDARYTPGAGVGYEFVRRPWVEWEGSLAAAFQHTNFRGGGDADDFATLIGTELDFDFDAVDWDNLYRLQVVATEIGRTSHHLESVLSFDIWGPLDLDVTFVWDRILKPETDPSGGRPKSDDVRLSVGLGLDF